MRKVILYIACSLNGKIAKSNGSVEWLQQVANPEKSDFGYNEFYGSVDVTIQGNNTWKQIESWGIEFPYKEKTNYVFTRNATIENNKYVQFISDNHAGFIRKLKEEKGKDIWLVGGNQLNSFFLAENLLDEIRVFIMPLILDKGIDLTGVLPTDVLLQNIKTEIYSNGVVEIRYSILKGQH